MSSRNSIIGNYKGNTKVKDQFPEIFAKYKSQKGSYFRDIEKMLRSMSFEDLRILEEDKDKNGCHSMLSLQASKAIYYKKHSLGEVENGR